MPIRAKPRELHWFFVIMSAEIRQKHFPFSAPFALQYICTKLTENFINKTIFIYTFFFVFERAYLHLNSTKVKTPQNPKNENPFYHWCGSYDQISTLNLTNFPPRYVKRKTKTGRTFIGSDKKWRSIHSFLKHSIAKFQSAFCPLSSY